MLLSYLYFIIRKAPKLFDFMSIKMVIYLVVSIFKSETIVIGNILFCFKEKQYCNDEDYHFALYLPQNHSTAILGLQVMQALHFYILSILTLSRLNYLYGQDNIGETSSILTRKDILCWKKIIYVIFYSIFGVLQ